MHHLYIASVVTILLSINSISANAYTNQKIFDKPLVLKIQMNHKLYPRYDENWPVEQAARAITNIHLKDATIGDTTLMRASDGKTEALNLMLESGQIPDIVASSRLRNFVNQYGPAGAFTPLDDLINEHAPNIKAFFDKNPKISAAITASNGSLYYIPYLPDGKYGRAYFIRQDWLNKLGLKTPNNVAELKKVLEAFRDRDPNGNGKKDEIPYFARHWPEFIRLVTLWDGRSSGSDTYHDFYVDKGKIKHPYAGDGYREGIKNLAQWYKEGLIHSSIFKGDSKTRMNLLSNNLGGMTHDWFASTSSFNTSLKNKINGFSFKAFAPPASISGKRIEEHRRIPVKPDGWAIGYTNKHPIETIKYFDFWFSPEGRRLVNFGVEGKQYTIQNGKAVFTEEVLNNTLPVNKQLYQVGAQLHARGFYQDYNYEKQWSNKDALEGIALYDKGNYLIDQFLGVAFNAEEQETYNKYWPAILDHMLERQKAWLLGEADIEKEWNNYILKINSLGLEKILVAMQTAYDRQYKTTH